MLDRPQTFDALLAAVLAAALELEVLLSRHLDANLVTVVGALAVTVPLAWRRRAPLAVAAIFAARQRCCRAPSVAASTSKRRRRSPR